MKRALLLIVMIISCNFLGNYAYGQQQGNISGTIIDESGTALPGVNVLVKGTTIGAITDINGKFSLNVPDQNAIIVASFIGYVPVEIPVAGKTTINITLVSDATQLQEVVVVGYGVQKKVNVIGSITTISSEEITAAPSANVSSALSGRMPGLFVTQTSGRPGADNSTLTIRGTATIANESGNTNILVVVDGIPGRDLNSLEPGDIESLSVLKDASAGIYGSRAANGVILVTTKKGIESAPRFEYEFYKGWSSASIIPAVTDAPTYAQMIREVQTYRNVLPENQVFSAEDVEKYRSGLYPWLYPNTDWASAVLKDFSASNHHTFRVSGGSKMVKYYGAFGAQTDDGIYKSGSSNFHRYNARLNLDVTINDYLSLNLNMGASESDVMQPYNTSFSSILRNLPTSTAIWPTGEPGPDIEKAQQPVTDTDASKTGYQDNRDYRSENMLTATLKIPWVDGLSVIGNYSYDLHFSVDKAVRNICSLYFLDKAAYLAAGNDGSQNGQAFLKAQVRAEIADPRVTDTYGDSKTITNSLKINYDKTFGKHTVSTFVAVESMDYLSKGIEGYRRFFQTVDLPYLNFGGTTEMSNDSNVSIDARLNYFGRFAYNYSEKYLFEFTLRRDGSLRFNKEAGRWGTFPSVLLGWRASSEDFWKNNIGFINYFKLKASWGQLGNDAVDAFQYLAMFSSTTDNGVTFGSARSFESSLYQVGEPNPEITWEVANVFNVGFESYFLDSKIKFDVDAFYQKRTDILVARNASVPAFTGLSLPDENFGIVTSKGFDAQLGFNNKSGQFSYGVTGNFSFARNKIIEYDEPSRSYDYQRLTGHPTGSFLQYKAIGIYKDAAQVAETPHVPGARAGDVILWDYNDDGSITSADRIVYDLNGRPEITFGINFSVQYKSWQLQALVQGVGNNWKRIADTEGAFMYSGTFGNYYQYYANDRWTETNTDATMHRAFERVEEYWRTDQYLCSFDYYNMAFARLKNLELSYSLPSSLLNSIKVKSASVYVTGKNLFFIYNKNEVGYDPETMGVATYPTTRVIAVGARVSF